ncbi:MAG TPA: Ig-like domain-containing protein [Longimicrobiales bacterium]
MIRNRACARRIAIPLGFACALFLAGCPDGDDPVVPDVSIPAALEAVGELPDTAVVGTMLTNAPRVRVSDEDGEGVADVPVAWRVVAGGGVLGADTTVTGADGVASVSWTLGTAVGENTVAASVSGLTEVAFTIEAVAGDPAVVTLSVDTLAFAALEAKDTLTAAVTDAYGNAIAEPTLVWTSTDGDVVRVDDAGTVTAAGAGTARIIAAAGAAADTVVAVVAQVPVGIALEPAADTLDALGESVQLTAVVRDANGHAVVDADVTWTSLDETIATVDANGNVLAVAPGNARIVAAIGTLADTATVLVRQLAPSVIIDPPAVTLDALGATAELSASVRDSNGHPVAGAVVTWTSLDEEIATITTAADIATVTAHAVGEARIVATAAGIADTDTAMIVVRQVPATVTLTPAAATLDALGDSVVFDVTVEDANGNPIPDAEVEWSRFGDGVGTVEPDAADPSHARLVAEAVGIARVVATAGAAADTATIEVRQVAATVTLEPEEHTLNALGDVVQLTATVRDANGNAIPGAVIAWTSTDDGVAPVDGDGTVTADAVGTVDIIAAVDEVADTASITVRQVPASITPLAPADTTLYQDSIVQFAVVVRDSNDVVIPEPDLTWSTSNENVADIDADGTESLVTAQREGVATITVATEVAGVQASATVRVPGLIAFVSTGTDGHRHIFVMNEDGTDPRQVTSGPYDDFDPAWSPDGSNIVFVSDRDDDADGGDREIFIVSASGGTPTQVTDDALDDLEPSWSPDGTKIVFRSERADTTLLDIFVMNVDGTGRTAITATAHDDFDPVWSPDGMRIAFSSNPIPDGEVLSNNDVYVMDADGANQTRLTTDSELDFDPAWSPTGTQIVFASDRDGDFEIFVINDDGSGLSAPLTSNAVNDGEPVWSADGTRIVFWRGDAGEEQIYIMNADGSGQRPIGATPIFGTQPVWRPQAEPPQP